MARPIKKQNWTTLDAFGMLNGISTWDDNYQNLQYVKLPDETSLELRQKILNMHDRPIAGTSIQDTINGISNQLMLSGYDISTKHNFFLTRDAIPYGEISTQDVWVDYQPPNETGWYSITPQWWSNTVYTDYDTTSFQTSGFILWQNEYYRNETTEKRFNYSKNLQILSDLPDKSKLRVKYYIKSYDEQYNPELHLFTDIDNPYDPNATSFEYRSPYALTQAELKTKVSAYTLADIPAGLSGLYFNSDGSPTEFIYNIRNYMDKNLRHRWKDITNKSTIWDVHRRYARGVIPSFYDTGFVIPSGEFWSNQTKYDLTGGVDHEYPSLYMSDIAIVNEGSYERWYPVLQPGTFYVAGVPYYLMNSPTYRTIPITGTSTVISSGEFPERGMYIIGYPSGFYSDLDERILFEDYRYPVSIKYDFDTTVQEYISSTVYRHRPYLTSNKGLAITLADDEYAIDYETNTIHVDSAMIGNNVTLVWDENLIPSGKIVASEYTDLNPLNDENLENEKYFLFIGQTEVL